MSLLHQRSFLPPVFPCTLVGALRLTLIIRHSPLLRLHGFCPGHSPRPMPRKLQHTVALFYTGTMPCRSALLNVYNPSFFLALVKILRLLLETHHDLPTKSRGPQNLHTCTVPHQVTFFVIATSKVNLIAACQRVKTWFKKSFR